MKKYFFGITLLFNTIIFGQPSNPAAPALVSGKYQIANLENLYWITQDVSRLSLNYEQTADIDASDTRNWGTIGFPPIGLYLNTDFTGTYDGKGYKISNLKMSNNNSRIGLFFQISGSASLQRIGLENVNITGQGDVGALVGRVAGGSITLCASSGSVSGVVRVGGLVGSIFFHDFNSTPNIINKSYSSANCFSSTDDAGGLVGHIDLQNSSSTRVAVSNCFSTGNVRRTAGSGTNFGNFIGRILNKAGISNSYATGTVTYAGTTAPTNKGFIGAPATGSYTNNFFDSQTSLQVSGSGALSKTTAEMQVSNTFTGWDFTNIWEIVPSNNNGYPNLRNVFAITLPVSWQSFTASKLLSEVVLNWSTASEQNTKDFEVLHSTDATNWTTLGKRLAAGNSNHTREYSYTHNYPLKNSVYNYYRIKQNDLDGQFSYSKIISIIYNERGADVMAYPNPASDKITVFTSIDEDVRLVNLAGSIVWRAKLTAGRQEINVAHLPKGVYLLQAGATSRRILLQ